MARRGKTPVRGIRIGSELWQAAQRTADSRREDLPEVIRDFLGRYAREELRAARSATPTDTRPDPAREWGEAWLEDNPSSRYADIHEAVEVVYGTEEADRVTPLVWAAPHPAARTATPTDAEEPQP